MRINKIECEQFAGLHDREYDFENGLNLLIGENESGKSSLVDLMYHLFFQGAIIDGRKDKDFKDRYFPKTTGKIQGDTIDGTIRFETEEGTYKLKKEWSGKDGGAKLTMPDGTTIRDNNKINEVLIEILGYGKGIYDELIFASQRRPQTILQGLLGNSSSESITELSASLTKAVMETGGIAIDNVENEMSEKLGKLDNNWDFSIDMPRDGKKRGITNKWKSQGEILAAYYEKEEISDKQEKARKAEERVEEINTQLSNAKKAFKDGNNKRKRFSEVRTVIETKSTTKSLLEKIRGELSDMENALNEWPANKEKLKKAEKLKADLEKAKNKELYDAVKELKNEEEEQNNKQREIGEIDPQDVKVASDLERDIPKLEAKLQGINLTAKIKKLGSADVNVISAVTGNNTAIEDDCVDISEAVDIVVPGVVDIQLSPKGVDIDSITKDLQDIQKKLKEIYATYSVETYSQLDEKQKNLEETKRTLNDITTKIEATLGDVSWESLERAVKEISDEIRSSKEIEQDIKSLCNGSIDVYIGSLSIVIDQYKSKYQDIGNLSKLIENKNNDVKEINEKLHSAENIPEEFSLIENPEEYDKSLKDSIDQTEKTIEHLGEELFEAEKDLGEKSAEEYDEDYRVAEEIFKNKKDEYFRWKHIFDVFISVKNRLKGNPLEDVEKYFSENLMTMSGGKLVLGTIDDKLNSSIASGNNRLTADILSDGTKDTIALAFRLAILKHLYPDGGCVAVFDDPFTDMDPVRTAHACKLIQDFAENNQVIFITCDKKYKELLKGNVINAQ